MADPQPKPLLPAYLIVGDDEHKRRALVERLRNRVAECGDIAFNEDVFDGANPECSDIVIACNTMPFASPYRYVLVRNADKLPKVESEALVEYLSNPNPTTVLCLEAGALAANTRLYKAVGKVDPTAIVSCALPKSGREKEKALRTKVRELAPAYGVTFSDQAADRLVELIGEDTVFLDREIQKIALAHKTTQPVSPQEVDSLVVRMTEKKPWDLQDALTERKLNQCLTLCALMPSTTPTSLLAFCVIRIRELLKIQALQRRGIQGGALASALNKKDWQVSKLMPGVQRYSPEELQQALIAARDAEQAMKSGSDQEAILLQWLTDTVIPQRRL